MLAFEPIQSRLTVFSILSERISLSHALNLCCRYPLISVGQRVQGTINGRSLGLLKIIGYSGINFIVAYQQSNVEYHSTFV